MRQPTRTRFGMWLLALMLVAHAFPASAAAGECPSPLPSARFGVLPWLTGPALQVWVRELSDHLRRVACIDARFGGEVDFAEHIDAARTGRYAFLIEPAHVGLLLVEQHGFALLGVERPGAGEMALFVMADSPVRSTQQLQGRTLALPHELALVSLAAARRLQQLDVQVTYAYKPRHDYVLADVVAGQADAGGVYTPVLQAVATRERGIRILEVLVPRDVPNGVLVARRDVPAALREQVLEAMISFKPSPQAIGPTVAAATPEHRRVIDRSIAVYAEMLATQLANESGSSGP
ncbi:MAG TPA: PhnD/SsuA/transferrin family substrate-binding protein [Arenimonas sp.]|nr:PhnD/SsuA/transferrin family substrate-binding protein [Arenimonas sp.]